MNYNSIARELIVRFAAGPAVVCAVCVIFAIAPAYSAQNPQEKIIVILGDSLVAGYGLAPGEAFPEQLGKQLKQRGFNITVINAGVSGDTTASGLARFDWSVPQETSAIILELGANDALRGLSPEHTLKNLETIITKAQNKGIQVLLAGMQAPPNMGQDYVDRFNAIYPGLAKKYDLGFYPFFLDGVAAIAELNQADAIHPTAKGVEKIVNQFMPSAILLIERLHAK